MKMKLRDEDWLRDEDGVKERFNSGKKIGLRE
jgi:hypothetical protein